MVPQKAIKEVNGKPVGSCKITLIDIFTGETEIIEDIKLNFNALSFDFNSSKDFSPDADSIEIAKKCWDHILNPIGVSKFLNEIQGKKVMIIQNRIGFKYDQEDPEDDLLTL